MLYLLDTITHAISCYDNAEKPLLVLLIKLRWFASTGTFNCVGHYGKQLASCSKQYWPTDKYFYPKNYQSLKDYRDSILAIELYVGEALVVGYANCRRRIHIVDIKNSLH